MTKNGHFSAILVIFGVAASFFYKNDAVTVILVIFGSNGQILPLLRFLFVIVIYGTKGEHLGSFPPQMAQKWAIFGGTMLRGE